jgi:dTDP-4-amino-4,6-dideoxygalactose transaminase
VGSSYLLSDLLAAVLCAQLEARDAVQAARRRVWERYDTTLRPWAESRGVRAPYVPAHCTQPYHMYYLLMPSLEQRQELIARFRKRGILCVFHYLPLHLSEMGRRFGSTSQRCPVSKDVSDRLLRLPFYSTLAKDDQDEVIGTLMEEYDRL